METSSNPSPEPSEISLSLFDEIKPSTDFSAALKQRPASPFDGPGCTFIIIEQRAFVRDCLVHSLKQSLTEEIVGFSGVAEFEQSDYRPDNAIIFLLCAGGRCSVEVERDWLRLQFLSTSSSVIVLADDDTPSGVFYALNGGVKGYIPTSVSVSVAVGALNLVKAGGVFIPLSCLSCAWGANQRETRHVGSKMENTFTARQIWVIGEIVKGKSNKLIASSLNIEESTVKVHVRNIMQKLKAHSRTEVAFIVSKMGVQIA